MLHFSKPLIQCTTCIQFAIFCHFSITAVLPLMWPQQAPQSGGRSTSTSSSSPPKRQSRPKIVSHITTWISIVRHANDKAFMCICLPGMLQFIAKITLDIQIHNSAYLFILQLTALQLCTLKLDSSIVTQVNLSHRDDYASWVVLVTCLSLGCIRVVQLCWFMHRTSNTI